jgi:precorrin-6y C5,15-methyltransferase (decarboxylating) CbiE subunit/precorrin-6Y C5,15-methyltransferase (decarboxylating) CbiT subunit
MPSEVLLIGIGPKGRYSLTEETLKLLKTSQIIIGGKKLLSQFKDFTAKTIILPSDLSKVLEILKENPDGIAAILALGNENLYGLSRFLYQRFDKNSLRIIPNIEQMKLAFAAANMAMDGARTLFAQDINLENSHEWLQPQQISGIFTDLAITPSGIAKALFKQGIKDLTALVCQDMGTKRAKVVRSDIEGLMGHRFPPLSVLILAPASSLPLSSSSPLASSSLPVPSPAAQELPAVAIKAISASDTEFVHTDRMLLNQEIRLVCLGKLRLDGAGIIWDISAGCGAVSIGASSLLPSGDIYAIEQDFVQIRHLYENIKRFGAHNVTVIEGKPPEAFKALPDPDRILIEGITSRMKETIETAWPRLKTQGVMVICTRQDYDITEIRDVLKNLGLSYELTAINFSKVVFKRGEDPETLLIPIYFIAAEKT